MAKTETPETETETGDQPLIDLNDVAIKKLIARAKKKGIITYDELNEALPQDQMSSEQIEDIMSAISEMGVNIVESTDSDDEEEKDEPEEEIDPLDDGSPRPAVATKKEAVDRTDDPVRMYLREMGAVELLSREGEIAIAKRIEAGRDTMIWGLCESPITFNAIIHWSDLLNQGQMQLREILDLEAMLSKGPTAEQVEGAEDDDGTISESTAGPSFKEEEDVEVPELGTVRVDVAWGGMFYVIADARPFGFKLVPAEGGRIVRIGEMIKVAAREQLPVAHPENPAIEGISISQLSGPPHDPAVNRRNAVIVSTGTLDWDRPETWTGAIDRSPCGTGTCAAMAVLHAKGELGLREDFVHGDTPRQATVNGMGHGGRVVTAAALIMTAVFAGFVLVEDPIIKSVGFALAIVIRLFRNRATSNVDEAAILKW